MSAARRKVDALVSSYRVQLTDSFGFRDLRAMLPYFERLGVRTLYLSPVLEAAPGSRHFYDVTNPENISPSLGGEEDLTDLLNAVSKARMKIMLDVVPNHMALNNPLIYDVLSMGLNSEFRNYFDIDWHHPRSFGKLILPVLDGYFDKLVQEGRINISGNKLRVDGMSLPLAKNGLSVSRGEDYRSLLEQQNFLLTSAKTAGVMINYRRFFAVNSMIALNMKDESVFSHYHAKTFELMDSGKIDALRIDHIDGLNDPEEYLGRIRERYPGTVILVEKIFTGKETIPEQWGIQGSTGYDSLRMINSIFIQRTSLEEFRRIFREFSGGIYETPHYTELLKFSTIARLFRGDIGNIARKLSALNSGSLPWYGVPRERLEHAISLVFSFLRYYRTYSGRSYYEVGPMLEACDSASTFDDEHAYEISLFRNFIESAHEDEESLHLLMEIESFTGAITAKAVEDCLLYRYVPALSCNEVGSNPLSDPPDTAEFFDHFISVSDDRSMTLVNTSTHDTKMGEDLRARYNALLQFPDLWSAYIRHLPKNSYITRKDRYLIAQAVVASLSAEDIEEWKPRLHGFIVKALREAGESTTWETPDEKYESECLRFADILISSGDRQFSDLVRNVRNYGTLNSIAQTFMKFMLPGTANIYQGCEVYNFNFVDPDNRRDVDFHRLDGMLKAVESHTSLGSFSDYGTDEFKLWLTSVLLKLRTQYADFITEGKFMPVQWEGPGSEFLVSFGYQLGKDFLLVVVTRYHRMFSEKEDYWKTNRPHIKTPEFAGGRIRNILDDRELRMDELPGKILDKIPAGAMIIRDIHGSEYEL